MNPNFERLRPIVDSALRRIARRSDPEYEDLVQGALMSLIAAMEPDTEYPVQWLTAVARNVTIDRLRARTRERRVFSRDVDVAVVEPAGSGRDGPEHLAHVHEQIARVDVALRGLGPKRAAVIYLHDVLGYGLREIGEEIGISVAAAQSRLVRGRRTLIQELSGEHARAARGRAKKKRAGA